MRERRRRRVSREIQRIALELFAERGFDSVTVDEIAAAADIHPRTFFRYFPSKEHALVGDPRGWLDDMHDAFLAHPEMSAGAALRAGAVAAARLYDEDPDVVLLRSRVAKANPEAIARGGNFPAPVLEALTAAVAERLKDEVDGMQTRLIVNIAIITFHLATSHWIEGGAKGSLRTQVEQAFRMLGSDLFM